MTESGEPLLVYIGIGEFKSVHDEFEIRGRSDRVEEMSPCTHERTRGARSLFPE